MGASKSNKELPIWLLFQDKGIHMDDYVDTRNFLRRIGYDTSKSVYHQFCKKWGLPTPPSAMGGRAHKK